MLRRTYLGALAVSCATAGCIGNSDENPDPENQSPETSTNTSGTTESSEQSSSNDPSPTDLTLNTVAAHLTQPVAFASVPGEDLRYVVERTGVIQAHSGGGLEPEPLLDLREQLSELESWEQGLLGITLHPEFHENHRLFIRYSAPPRTGVPEDYSHTFVLSEFQVGEDLLTANPASERTVMEIPQPGIVHNAGDIQFGPEGRLYVPTGDGGGGYGDNGPGHPEDWYEANAGGNGQDTSEFLLGGILRIDVDSPPTEAPRTDPEAPDQPEGGEYEGYAVPSTNPLYDVDGHRDEYYAWGFRNPWQCSFHDDDLFVADVGSENYHGVYLVEKGGNYGWNVREASHCFDTEDHSNPADCPNETPEDVRGGEPLQDPIVEYAKPEHSSAIIGGHVVTDDSLPVAGEYVFADLQPEEAGGLFAASSSDGDGWSMRSVPVQDWPEGDTFFAYTFGREAGSLYLLGGGFAEEAGVMCRLTATQAGGD